MAPRRELAGRDVGAVGEQEAVGRALVRPGAARARRAAARAGAWRATPLHAEAGHDQQQIARLQLPRSRVPISAVDVRVVPIEQRSRRGSPRRDSPNSSGCASRRYAWPKSSSAFVAHGGEPGRELLLQLDRGLARRRDPSAPAGARSAAARPAPNDGRTSCHGAACQRSNTSRAMSTAVVGSPACGVGQPQRRARRPRRSDR